MKCKCCIDNIECSWPYHVIEPYISVKAKGDITMADEKSCDVKFSLVTVRAIEVNNLSENKVKDSEIHLKFTNDQVLHTQWCNGDIGPIGLEMDQPSRPSSPIDCLCTDKCSSSFCDKSKNATDNGVNSKFDSEKEQVYPNINCEIPSIFLNNAIGCSTGSTQNLNVEFNAFCTASNTSTKEENVSLTTDEYLSDDCTSSSYYVPSTMSLGLSEDCETFKSPVPPIRPPRTARLRREKTQSEADACLSTASVISYKSLRSQSDPSAHFTTVVKPRAMRPSCGAINVSNDSEDFEINTTQTVERQQAFQESCGPSSAFKEHTRSVRTEARARTLFYSRSLEIASPSSDEPVFLENGSVVTSQLSENASQSRIWARSMTDVLENSGASNSVFSKKDLKQKDRRTMLKQDKDSSQSTSKLCEAKTLNCNEDSIPTSNGHITKGCNFKENSEPIHMTLEEVKNNSICYNNKKQDVAQLEQSSPEEETKKSPCRQFFRVYFRPRKSKKCASAKNKQHATSNEPIYHHRHSFPVTMKAAISSLFGLKRNSNSPSKQKPDYLGKVESSLLEQNLETPNGLLLSATDNEALDGSESDSKPSPNTSPFTNRALPPLPVDENGLLHEPTVCVRDDEDSSSLSALSTLSDNYISTHSRTRSMDYAASIEKVKDCGWYWGPISGETAEKLLSNEPDGAFVVRDSSDEHYIFSLTFKLNGWVRHVRIEHDHGNFSFGCQQKFRSNTIVDFIENAVEHSRSGRYLFFLHRRPVLGPMRVQLLHPVSRFKQVQSLQHMCRFVILKSVRRDLIDSLPLPRTLRDYLNTPHYYSEELSHLSTLATAALSASANIAASSAATSRGDTEVEPS